MPLGDKLPKFAIPTVFGWLLLKSLVGGSLWEKAAEIAAAGASQANLDNTTAWETYRKNLRQWAKGRQPRPGTLARLQDHMERGLRVLLRKSMPSDSKAADVMFGNLNSACGPFTALAAGHMLRTPNKAQQRLLDFSTELDQLGAAFLAAAEKGDLETAKDLLLGKNWLDDAYWAFPEPGMENPQRNRAALRAAANWEQVARACAPLVLNTSLAWLSYLDLTVQTGSGNKFMDVPLFLPLATRFTPEAAAAMREGRPLPAGKWSETFELPVPNLIKMLKKLAPEADQRIQKGMKSGKSRGSDRVSWTELSNTLKKFSREDLLSTPRFNNLLGALEPDGLPKGDAASSADIHALHLAANFFSLLTPRDNIAPTNESRRKRAASITICEEIPGIYEQWWRRNRSEVAGDAVEHPRLASAT